MNKKKAFSFVCKKLLSVKIIPAGWKPRKAHDYEWFLTADKGSSQPLGVYVKESHAQVDNRFKNGYQASLGEFAGTSCRIAPLRSMLREALKDCFEFMRAHNIKRLLKIVSHAEPALHCRVWIRFVAVSFNHHTASTFCERFSPAKIGSSNDKKNSKPEDHPSFALRLRRNFISKVEN